MSVTNLSMLQKISARNGVEHPMKRWINNDKVSLPVEGNSSEIILDISDILVVLQKRPRHLRRQFS